jgi:hypothetical protein
MNQFFLHDKTDSDKVSPELPKEKSAKGWPFDCQVF